MADPAKRGEAETKVHTTQQQAAVRSSADTNAFEALRGESSRHYSLRLFVTGATPRSARAIRNIRAICEDHLAGRYDLEVIDIYQCPERIQAEQIVVSPTLVKEQPFPPCRMIGDLSDTDQVLLALNITRRPAPGPLPEHSHDA
jgi:circadian clock protein KaiB